jgi:hypothetical protein
MLAATAINLPSMCSMGGQPAVLNVEALENEHICEQAEGGRDKFEVPGGHDSPRV